MILEQDILALSQPGSKYLVLYVVLLHCKTYIVFFYESRPAEHFFHALGSMNDARPGMAGRHFHGLITARSDQ